MKTKFYFFACIQLLLLNKLEAQIPNPSFENWINVGGWFDIPSGWSANNSQIITSVVAPDSDAYSGSLAMHLQNVTTIRPAASTQFPIVSNIISLTAYVKLSLIINDTVKIKVLELSNGLVVDSGEWLGLSDIQNYSPITIPVSQSNTTIDSAIIEISGGNQTNLIFESTVFLVDDLSLNTVNGIQSFDDYNAKIWPNPVTTDLMISLNKNTKIGNLSIYTYTGKLIKTITSESLLGIQINGHTKYHIPVQELNSGLYLLNINGEMHRNIKFFKE